MENFFSGSNVEKTSDEVVQPEKKTAERLENIGKWLKTQDNVQCTVALLYGLDGVAKSGLSLDYPLKEGEKMVVVDLDRSAMPVVISHHKERYKRGDLIVKDPTVVDIDNLKINYTATFQNIMDIVEWVKKNHQQERIKVFVFDGVSTLLRYCEFFMRDKIGKGVGEGVDLRMWQIRAKMFTEIVTAIKSLDLQVLFISHENFIIPDSTEKVSSVVARLNQMCYQKIRLIKESVLDGVVFKAQIDKSKYNAALEGQVYTFLTVGNKKVNWTGSKVWKEILE